MLPHSSRILTHVLTSDKASCKGRGSIVCGPPEQNKVNEWDSSYSLFISAMQFITSTCSVQSVPYNTMTVQRFFTSILYLPNSA